MASENREPTSSNIESEDSLDKTTSRIEDVNGLKSEDESRLLYFLRNDKVTSQQSSSTSSSPDSETPSLRDDDTSLLASSSQLELLDPTDSAMVPLEPFVHQVGGHFPMVCLATETICKPLNDREHNFYRTLPGILQPYAPKFEGIMSVSMHEDEHGYITLMGTPPNCFGLKAINRSSVSVPASIPASGSGSPRERVIRLSEDSSLDDLNKEDTLYPVIPPQPQLDDDDRELDDGEVDQDEVREEIYCNPWALKCHRDHLKKLGLLSSAHSSQSGGLSSPTGTSNNATQLYLLLENLVSKYTRPCVLDLKVGSRQYPDNVCAAKKQRKIEKSATTTSSTLGLRLCGMQVFSMATGKFLCHNKYYGRTLNPSGFKSAIAQFLNNTDSVDQLRVDIILQLVDKLKRLVGVLKQLESFRFYTSSLLVTYDGAIRPPLSSNGPVDKSVDPVDKTVDLVDVRIIDFAHSTHKGLKDSTLHSGPDDGFIFGIENFIRILGEILDDHHQGEKENMGAGSATSSGTTSSPTLDANKA